VRYWTFPEFDQLLPALRDLAWKDICAGRLVIEAVRGLREKGARRVVATIHLQRLAPDWELSRLCRDADDVFVDVCVRRPIMEAPGDQPPSQDELRAAIRKIAEAHSGESAAFAQVHVELNALLGREVPRDIARVALDYAPGLRRRPGRARTKKSPE